MGKEIAGCEGFPLLGLDVLGTRLLLKIPKPSSRLHQRILERSKLGISLRIVLLKISRCGCAANNRFSKYIKNRLFLGDFLLAKSSV